MKTQLAECATQLASLKVDHWRRTATSSDLNAISVDESLRTDLGSAQGATQVDQVNSEVEPAAVKAVEPAAVKAVDTAGIGAAAQAARLASLIAERRSRA